MSLDSLMRRLALLALAITVPPRTASAQTFLLAGQMNVIGQRHGTFPSPYSGPQSFRSDEDPKVSSVLTLYTGIQLPKGWDVVLDVESAGGAGLSDAFGLAGFTNLDVVRNPTLGTSPYLARLIVHKVLALTDRRVNSIRTPLSLPTTLPERRIEIRAGKIGVVDFFDVNAVGGDSHLQFTNWTVDNNGAYDYAADTRGYTYGVVVEYDTPRWSIRGAEALMPTVANGIVLDWHVARSRGENVELELHPSAPLTLKLVGFVNHANMGSYTEAIDAFRAGRDATPDIEAHRTAGRIKGGAGVNVEYDLPDGVRLFARSGWNGGDSESFAYTEVNDTMSAGGDVSGTRWQRRDDRAGVAFASNGLSAQHREYLRLGGHGFLLGDGTLTYGRENVVEAYYTAHVWRGLFLSAGLQYLHNPGYNSDRGPVFVQSARVHVDF
ncbi:MAG TPA: carbohydrate porin [Vicinamibacterales bacterium]|nr:carbohydrate porin [Vicinamibacterales bacterium]